MEIHNKEAEMKSSSSSSTANVKLLENSLWSISQRNLVNSLAKKLLEGGHHYSYLFSLLQPLCNQFNKLKTSGSKTLISAHVVLNGLNYSLCLDYKSTKYRETYSRAISIHRSQVRLLLLALLVFICKRMTRVNLLALFSTPIIPHVSLNVGHDWTITTSQDTIQDSFVSLLKDESLMIAYVLADKLNTEN